MTDIDNMSIYQVLKACGFFGHKQKKRLFLIDDRSQVTPAFHCVIYRRNKRARFGGGFGLYFKEFESVWSSSLQREDRVLDATLPLIMLIDNYRALIEADVFRFSDDIAELHTNALQIYDICSRLPNSVDEFHRALISKRLLNKNISDYLHIHDYNPDDDLYFRKSVSFVCWFVKRWPEFSEDMYQCLTNRQLQRLGLQ